MTASPVIVPVLLPRDAMLARYILWPVSVRRNEHGDDEEIRC